MANHEACDLYIEQQISEGLEAGQSPYAIGKGITLWVAKLFDVKIKTSTITRRVERAKRRVATNVAKSTEQGSARTGVAECSTKHNGTKCAAQKATVYQDAARDSYYLRKQTLAKWRTVKRRIEDAREFISDNLELPAPDFVKMSLLAEILTEFSSLETLIEIIKGGYDERKEKKINVKALIDEFRGKDKVTIKSMRKEENGKWRVTYMEEAGRTDVVDFDGHHDAHLFCFAFGGKNHLTVSAPVDLLDLSNWVEKNIREMGHKVLSISLSQSYSAQNTDKKIEHKVPPGCGSGFLPGKNKRDGSGSGISIFERFVQTSILQRKKVEFSEDDSIDKLREFLVSKFPEYSMQVSGAVTLNQDYNALCVWVRKKVGDGSKRMQLRLEKINGESFQEFMYSDILKYADGMASTECERVYIKKRREVIEDRCGFSLV